MKLNIRQRSSKSPVRKVPVGGKNFCFRMPDKLKSEMDKLYNRGAKAGLTSYTYSYILREGALLMIRLENQKLDKATKGELHAKKRKEAVA